MSTLTCALEMNRTQNRWQFDCTYEVVERMKDTDFIPHFYTVFGEGHFFFDMFLPVGLFIKKCEELNISVSVVI